MDNITAEDRSHPLEVATQRSTHRADPCEKLNCSVLRPFN